MKCLMRMYAEEDKGVVFFETVLSMKKQRHTFIECIPVPWELFDLLPGYFKVRQSDLLCQSQDAANQTVGVNTFLRGGRGRSTKNLLTLLRDPGGFQTRNGSQSTPISWFNLTTRVKRDMVTYRRCCNCAR